MATIAQRSIAGLTCRSRSTVVRPVCTKGATKTDLKKVGINSVKDEPVHQNLMGRSRYMNKKDWVDAQGRKGKGLGVYRFQDKYGANVDGYSPIYTPDLWAPSGNSYQPGLQGLLAWAGLFLVVLLVGANLIASTSQLGQ